MSKEMIGLILTGFAIWLILLPVLWGAIRGRRQSAFRLIWIVATAVVSVLLAMLLAGIILNVVKIDNKSIPEYAMSMLEKSNAKIRSSLEQNPEMRQTIVNLVAEACKAGLRLVLFVVCFWLLKWLLFPVWKSIANRHYSNKPIKSRQITTQDGTVVPVFNQKPQKKGALIGMAYGLVMGLFVMVLTFIPLSMANNLVMAVETQTKTETEDGILTNMLRSNAQYLTAYQDSIIGKVLITTKIDAVQNFVGDQLTTINIGGQRASITGEVQKILPVYKDVKSLLDIKINELTQAKIDEIIPIAKRVTNTVLTNQAVKGMYELCRDFVVDGLLDTEHEFIVKLPTIDDAELNTVLRDCVAQVKTMTLNDVYNDLLKVFDVASELNSTPLLVDALKRDITLNNVKTNLTATLAKSINQKLAETSFMIKCFPIAFNPVAQKVVDKIPAIEYAGSEVKIVWTNTQNVSAQNLKNDLDNILDDIVYIIKGVSQDAADYDANNYLKIEANGGEYYVKYSVFENAGGLIDSLKNSNLLNNTTYQSMMTYAKSGLKSFVETGLSGESYEHLLLATNKIIDTLSTEPSFRTEFAHVANAIKVYVNAEEADVTLFAEIVDKLIPSYIYSHNIGVGANANEDSEYVYSQLNEFLSTFLNDQFGDFAVFSNELINQVLGKVKNITSYKLEYENLESLIDFFQTESDYLTNENLETLGEQLDAIKNVSQIFDDSLIKSILKSAVDKVELPDQIKNVMIGSLSIKEQIKLNVNNITNYKSELMTLGDALNTDFSAITNLAGYGEVLDKLSSSVLLGNTINAIAQDQFNKQATDLNAYANAKARIYNNLSLLTNNYETQFEKLDSLVTFVKNTADITQTASLQQLGAILDDIKAESLLIDDTTCKLFIKDYLDANELPNQIKNVMVGDLLLKEKLKQNVNNITSFETELAILGEALNTDFASITNLAGYGHVMDTLAGSVLFNGTLNPIALDQLSQYQSDFADYPAIYDDISTNLSKLENTYELEFGYVDDFINNVPGVMGSVADINNYLKSNLLDENEKSKSVLLDDKTLYDLVVACLDDVDFGGESITAFGDLKAHITTKLLESDLPDEDVTICDGGFGGGSGLLVGAKQKSRGNCH